MLYTPKQAARDQLLADLTAVRAVLAQPGKWTTGSFQQGDSLCIVAACELVTQEAVGRVPIVAGPTCPRVLRMGHVLAAVYRALKGPKAPTNVPMTVVQSTIIGFNDGAATHAAVLLLLDRAVEYCLAPAAA